MFYSLKEAEVRVVGFRSIQDGGRQIQDQGCKTALESMVDTPKAVTNSALTWPDAWWISQAKLNFLIRSTFITRVPETFISGMAWSNCWLCGTHNPSLQHMLTGSKSTWPGTDGPTTGSYGKWQMFWRPTNLKQMSLLPFIQGSIHLVRQKTEEGNTDQREWSVRALGYEWNMQLDLNHQITFLLEITTTSLQLDIVLWSISARTVIVAAPWE